jgi:CubicO group peptidase (beta-lactamase class C family)
VNGPMPVLAGVSELLEAARGEGIAPSIAAFVLRRGAWIHESFHGQIPAPAQRALSAGDRFDVASLTKVMATTSVAVQLVAEGLLELDGPASAWLPGFDRGDRAAITVRHLLAHSSGLPGWRPFFERAMADPVAGKAFLPPAERPSPRELVAAFTRGEAILQEAIWASSRWVGSSRRRVETGSHGSRGDASSSRSGCAGPASSTGTIRSRPSTS